jgi:two-component system chemotaxis sensor kinase CheA
MDELLSDFLMETAEYIDAASSQLVQFERNPDDKSIIAGIFRLLHTIKGTCGFLGLNRLALLTHSAEALINRLREGVPGTPETVSLILEAIDRVKLILKELEETAHEPQGDDADLIEAIETQIAATLSQTHESPTAPSEQQSEKPTEPFAGSPASAKVALSETVPRRTETIRVTVDALERIMVLVSELVLTRNQLLDLSRRNDDETTKAPLQRLSSLTSDLQDTVMRARMQPMGRLFASLPRLIRDLSLELGKKLNLVTEGGDTELDRQLIELIRGPLTHLLRNCADHGIESLEERIAAGKPVAGTIQVIASHEAGYISIDVSDDGRGLDLARIRTKALSQGLATALEIASMPDDELCQFIFVPAFSTADTVTNISGRGIGMDVVRNNIEEIGGSISLTTTPGRGTRFSMKIPLTLAIAPALIVQVGTHRFALPQHAVVEVVGVGADSRHEVEAVRGSLVLRLRDEVLPLADLRSTLGLGGKENSPERLEQRAVVMRIGTHTFAVMVDAVADVQEVVVKPLGASLSHLKVFSGHTILGDGSVVLILDPSGIATGLGLVQTSDYSIVPAVEAPAGAKDIRLVLFRAGPGTVKAIPLSLIVRIETIASSILQRSDGMFIMQHRGQLMLILQIAETELLDEHPVLVLGVGGEAMGLLVDEILDIVEEPMEVEIASSTPGVIGTARIRNMIVEILDVTHFMRIARPNAFARAFSRRFQILLVDDKPFFRDMLAPVLAAGGYQVTTAESGHDALKHLAKGRNFDAVITDIDMPDMSGYALARTISGDPQYASLPILALAAHAAPAIEQAAMASGMCGVVGKFDRAALLQTLEKTLDVRDLGGHDLEAQIIKGIAA